ncbi:MAG: prepilin-type N-terminal cleavage/methylation domain-containing protein [Candidatus Hinthialibacter antarcticus]|nr:prepilin-type N-terminal cleavage/methylation domain-containing protein [Candidatus Hinthialibacter antarcticus]
MRNRCQRGFTLIELLIVVAIIGILAAIAVPNFLQAQIRAKVARVHGDMRSLSTAIEMYNLDNNGFPWFDGYDFPSRYHSITYRLIPLSTPVPYITLSMRDPFIDQQGAQGYDDEIMRFSYNYRNHQCFSESYRWNCYTINSVGPDMFPNKGLNVENWARELIAPDAVVIYDGTNGLVSAGDMPYTGGETQYQNNF